MSDDSSGGILAKIGRALRGAFLAHVPDHPAHGGNTGEAEWPPDASAEQGSDGDERDGTGK